MISRSSKLIPTHLLFLIQQGSDITSEHELTELSVQKILPP